MKTLSTETPVEPPTTPTAPVATVAVEPTTRRFQTKECNASLPDEQRFALDILDCKTLEEAQALAKRVNDEWNHFWACG